MIDNSRAVAALRDRIAANGGALSFAAYMAQCLYDSDFGYYTQERPKIGKEGDFYTSSAIGGLMGEVLAAYIAEQSGFPADEPVEIVEWGGGTGQLAEQLLQALQQRFPQFYERLTYRLIEESPHHRRLQAERLAAFGDKVVALQGEEWLAVGSRNAVVLANELLDAFPVHRVRRQDGELWELGVKWEEASQRLTEASWRCADPALFDYLAAGQIELAEGQTAEINLAAPKWIREALTAIDNGIVLAIDYGDVAAELYAPHRMRGTLMCYRRHVAHEDPYRDPGAQDITAHVDFSACMRAGAAGGASAQRLITQREFLVEAGILGLLADHAGTDPFSPAAKRNRAVRQLLLSDGMSELFKVLILRKGR